MDSQEEDFIDSEEAKRILSETKPEDWIPYSALRAELGLIEDHSDPKNCPS